MDERPSMWYQTTGLGEWEPRPGRSPNYGQWAKRVAIGAAEPVLWLLGIGCLWLLIAWFLLGICVRLLTE